MESKKKQELKKSVSVEAGRRRRGEIAIQLRKAQKEEGIAKRRNVSNETHATTAEIPETSKVAGDLMLALSDLMSGDSASQLRGTKEFRRALSVEKCPPVQQCIELGTINKFIDFLQRFDFPELQFEASWALTNIASTEHTSVLINYGAVPHLVKLLTSPIPEVREQSAWCLGNIAGYG
jgi:importin subunit alpha-1